VKSERIHTVNQLLKAYSLFEKDQLTLPRFWVLTYGIWFKYS
jgi:hypothetical protein